MRFFKSVVIFAVFSLVTLFCYAQMPVPASPTPAPLSTLTPLPSPAPAQPVPAASPAGSALAADPDIQPPSWVLGVLEAAKSLPVVGPIVTKVAIYLGVLCSILTALVCFLLTSLKAVSGVANIAGLAEFTTKLESFKTGPIMYWLKYFSMYNAQKPAVAQAALSIEKPAA